MKRLILLFCALQMVSCVDQYSEYLPNEKFKTLFADAGQGIDYFPIDIIQTEDGGYLILSEGALNSVFVMKIDSRGQQKWSTTMPATFENPVGDIVFSEGKYYFIASISTDQTAVLIEIDDLNQQVNATQRSYPGYRMPLAFGKFDSENYLMLNFNDTIGPVLSRIQSGFAMEWARSYDNNGLQKSQIAEALDSKTFNFFVGNINNGQNLFFNAIRGEGNVLTYTNDLGIATGKISASGSGEIISYNYLGNLVSAINYEKGANTYFQTTHPLNTNDSSNINQIEGEVLLDYGKEANALTVSNEIVANTHVINIYGTSDGRLKWSNISIGGESVQAVDYLGGQDPLRFVKAIESNDGGLVILASVLLGGTNARIMVQKIPSEELSGLTN